MIRSSRLYQNPHREARTRSCTETIVCLFIFVAVLIVVLVFITHLHALQVEYSSIMRTRENEEWLMIQCQSDEFYHNMKHHSALCDQIAQTQHEFVLLHALRNVIQTPMSAACTVALSCLRIQSSSLCARVLTS